MNRIIDKDKSIVPACDMTNLRELEFLVQETYNIEGISGYKVGKLLAYWNSLPEVVKVIRNYTKNRAGSKKKIC